MTASRSAAPTTALTGWGGTARTHAVLLRPTDTANAQRLLAEATPGRALGFRGLGRSYGDSAQSAGGAIIETTLMNGLLEFDRTTGVVRAEAGLSIDALLRAVLPAGWFVPVTPGTRQVTLGGAVAADIHGKNHHRDGTIGAHLAGLDLIAPDGTEHHLRPGTPLFDATVGGMGLTGLVSTVTLRLIPVTSAYMRVRTARTANIESTMLALQEQDTHARYSVAWLDCLSTGRSLGRGVVTSGDHAHASDLKGRARRDPQAFRPTTRLAAPARLPSGLLNQLSVRAFNEAWFRRAPSREQTSIEHAATFFHPLDGVANWNRIYGPSGFVQYQFVVPDGKEAAVQKSIQTLARTGAASFLAVLKRFGPEGSGMLSFPMPGWTLALDLPVQPGLAPLLTRLDELVLEAGGRLYLAKDSRMPRRMLEIGYPRLDEFQSMRAAIDPQGRIATDQSRRLRL